MKWFNVSTVLDSILYHIACSRKNSPAQHQMEYTLMFRNEIIEVCVSFDPVFDEIFEDFL